MKKRIAVVLTAIALLLSVCVCVPAAALASEVSSSEVVMTFSIPDDSAEEYIPDDEHLEMLLSDADGSVDNILIAVASGSDVPREQNIKDSLKIMGQGMLGIFVVMLLIYLVVVILNKVTHDSSEEENNE